MHFGRSPCEQELLEQLFVRHAFKPLKMTNELECRRARGKRRRSEGA